MDHLTDLFKFDTTTWILGGTLGVAFFMYDYWKKTAFQRNGVPGPIPLPLLGNALTFRRGFTSTITDLCEKYGKAFGVTFLSSKWLVVRDLELIQQILISQFSSFPNHGPDNPFCQDNMMKSSVVVLSDMKWKEARNAMTPAFSGSKLKQMTPIMTDCCDNLLAKIEELQIQSDFIQCKELFGAFTIDVVAATFFGLQLNSQQNPKDPFVQYAREALAVNVFSFRYIAGSAFPLVGRFFDVIDYGLFPRHIKKFFTDLTNQVIDSREKTKSKVRVDVLQLMVNAHKLEGEEEDGNHGDDNHHHKKIQFTNADITANTFTFFMAGYETTTTTLGFISYLLATNPDKQEKLIEEVDQHFPNGEPLTYETVNKMEYLEGVIKETLRLYPASSLTDRYCEESTVIGGVTVPAQTVFIIPIYTIHHDPEIWEDPESFKPERFNKENSHRIHPMAWLPFGGGPRICLGMRLAMMEMKFGVVRILQKYRFETCPETEIPPVLNISTGLISPPNGIKLRIVPRK
ncbi:cytochrome P450 3A24-like [Apostichopus japonicus]|uniref:cytochrome P450 3A24-like n=1 Tax=Stichopus japonicus TaxID=307972 RepID=UPI003AB6CA81